MTRDLHPVVGGNGPWSMGAVAVFFTPTDAARFIASEGRGDLFLGTPRTDGRTSGYRPAERDWRAEYAAWCAEVDSKQRALPEELKPDSKGYWQ